MEGLKPCMPKPTFFTQIMPNQHMESALFVQVLHILHGRNIAFQGGSNALRTDSDRATHELRYVIALHELAMVVGISRWQFERLRAMPVFVHVGNEGARVYAIGTTT